MKNGFRRMVSLFIAVALLFCNTVMAAETDQERVLVCGLEEHTHTEGCYETVLVCGQEEEEPVREYTEKFEVHKHSAKCRDESGNLVCGLVENEYYHTHNDFCYDENGNPVCGLKQKKPHEHTDDCYEETCELVCTREEKEGHTHDESCYEITRELVCGKEEDPGHTHNESCFEQEKCLVCELAETEGHTHTDDCYTLREELSCGLEESEDHTHTNECYTTVRELTCGKEEVPGHTHTEECYTYTQRLICEEPEREGHTHTELCFNSQKRLVCDKEECEGHTHTDECYKTSRVLRCDKPTSTHKHQAECYNAQGHVICGQVEVPEFVSTEASWRIEEGHLHSEACYEKRLICEKPEHVHTDDCYEKTVPQEVEQEITEDQDDNEAKNGEDRGETSEAPNNEPAENATESARHTDELPDKDDPPPEEEPSEEENTKNDQGNDTEQPLTDSSDTDNASADGPEAGTDAGEGDALPEQEDNDMDAQADGMDIEADVDVNIDVDIGMDNIHAEAEDNPADNVHTDVDMDVDNVHTGEQEAQPAENSETSAGEEAAPETIEKDAPAEYEQESNIVLPAGKKDEEKPEQNEPGPAATPTDLTEAPPEEAEEARDIVLCTDKDSIYSATVVLEAVTGIPDNARLIVREAEDTQGFRKSPQKSAKAAAGEKSASAGALTKYNAGEEIPDIELNRKTLVMTIDADNREETVQAKATVTVRLPEVTADQKVDVLQITEDGKDLLDSENNDGSITFVTDGLTSYEFVIYAKKLSNEKTDNLESTLWGSENNEEAYINQQVTAPEGVNVLETYSTPDGSGMWMDLRYTGDEELGELESIALYSIRDEALEDLVEDNIDRSEVLRVSLGDLPEYALVRDTGLRQTEKDLGNVVLNGLMPKNAEATAENITEEYADTTLAAEQEALPEDAGILAVYDISITNDGKEYQPGEEKPVTVTILDDNIKEGDVLWVLHIQDDGTTEIMESVTVEDGRVVFQATGFSAYAIAAGPSDVSSDLHQITSFDGLEAQIANGIYIGHWDNYYMDNVLVNNLGGTSGRTGIRKIKPSTTDPAGAGAAKYYFEAVDSANLQYKIYCYNANNEPQYVRWVTGNETTKKSLSFTTAANATTFIVEPYSATATDAFKIHAVGSDYYWNMQGGANGAGIAAYNNATDVNAKLRFVYKDEITEEPFGLENKSYGLMNWNSGVTGRAMMAEETGEGALVSKTLTVLTEKSNTADKLFVPNESDISFWTFHWANDRNYYIKTVVDGATKYLKISQDGLSLVDQEDAVPIEVKPGSGNYEGMVCLRANTGTITYGGSDTGFTVGGTAGQEWLYLVEESELTEDYYMTYSASKVSVSAEEVTNGSRIIVYTRKWNYDTDRYEFYAIDHDGTLVRCFESGDSIQWIGNRINTMLWNFVEYYWEGTDDPNFYYDLYNQYSEDFISPQKGSGQILDNKPIGINMNGRQRGAYYSTILAWDKSTQSYSGLKLEDGEDGKKHIVACDRDEAEDFYFAIMQDLAEDDETTTVPTVDHTQYGITMKMKDFDTRAEMSNFLGNDVGGMGTTTQPGLLSTQLGSDGYPTTAGGSLGTLYSGAQDVNHLFILSTYNGTGYYEYDSTQNFATLKGNTGGNFTVYKELGTYDAADSPTRKHGQFFPYNDLKPGVFSSVNSKNLYDVNGNPLPDSDPRKNEPLYLIQPRPGEKSVDCYFGMEIEASFVQTPSGYDAWGHDIIYEFTGDDDFWLYVDGELVIDLGGIHSAVPGSVNYHTGAVSVNGVNTTLRDVFYNNYLGRNHTAEEAQAYVDELFEEKTDSNGNTYYTFKDYTTHTMRIFYMERGAGGSNLHMRFNLASVKEGHVELKKELDGVDETESLMAEFPYQIWYVLPNDVNNTNDVVTERLLQPDNENGISVKYEDTNISVPYEESFTLNGKDDNGDPYTMTYEHVFLLKPGESADIDLPDNTILYRVTECGINTDVYSSVTVNEGDEPVTATAGDDYPDNRRDYGIAYESAKDRARVAYTNTVDPNALRTLKIRKMLYDEVGSTEVRDDYGTFEFRLYLDSEYNQELNLASMYTYHVLDENGTYCCWDSSIGRFVSLGEGKTDYTLLTREEKKASSIPTSIYGTISNIPSFYTVEVRELLVGTKYKVEERNNSIPKGYSRQKYVYYEDDEDASGTDMQDPVVGLIESGKDPLVEVCNLKGYGIAVNKTWSDTDFMAERDPAYFGLYYEAQGAAPVLADTVVDYPVMKLAQDEESLYWYIEMLAQNTTFANYRIYEVSLENPTEDADGNITAYDGITIIGAGDPVTINGRLKGDARAYPCEYTVNYGAAVTDPRNANVKSYDVTNVRAGITFVKEDMEGNRLAGAEFVLSDDDDNMHSVYTSDENGVITMAFLRENVEYTLEETRSPYTYRGYFGLQSPMKIKQVNGQITVTSGDPIYYEISGDGKTLTVKNRVYYLEVVKTNKRTGEPLPGAHFKLHRQVTVGGYTGFDFNPMEGYEDLVSGQDGIILKLDNTLPVGTYELREISAPTGYDALTSYIQFTISPIGEITLGTKHPADVVLDTEIMQDTSVQYTITVPNVSEEDNAVLTLSKTVRGNMSDWSKPFEFTLDSVADETEGTTYAYTKTAAAGTSTTGTITTGGTFTLAHGESIAISLPIGKAVSITEDREQYITSWVLNENPQITSNIITVTLTEDASVAVTNTLNAVAPTGARGGYAPWLILLIAGILVTIVQGTGKRAKVSKRYNAEKRK